MTVDKLVSKRQVLTSQRDQLMAQVNATEGAIAMCNELIGEAVRDAQAEKEREEAAAVELMAHMPAPPTGYCTVDGELHCDKQDVKCASCPEGGPFAMPDALPADVFPTERDHAPA